MSRDIERKITFLSFFHHVGIYLRIEISFVAEVHPDLLCRDDGQLFVVQYGGFGRI